MNKLSFLYLLVCLSALCSPRAYGAASQLDELMELITGTFDSAVQAAQDQRYDHAVWHRVEIWPESDGVRWVYSENWLAGADKPYRQRVTRFSLDQDGSIVGKSFRIPDAERYLGAWQSPAKLESLDRSRLQASTTCEVRLAKTGPRRFEGSTDGQQCRNNYKGASYVVSRSVIDEQGYRNWDRGFDAQGNQVWGPKTHGYRFQRSGAAQCAQPVMMLVYGEITDRARFGAYVKAIADSGLYPKHQGYYRIVSPAQEIFEGEPPLTRGLVLVRFPCLDAARGFWYSDAYTRIRELRKDIATFEVSVFKELPVPDYVEW